METFVVKALKLFRGDARRVMKQNLNGYNIYHEGFLNVNDWENHIEGSVSAAIYLLNEKANCCTVCFDVDIPKLNIPDNYLERELVKKQELLPLVRKIVDYLKNIYAVTDKNIVVEDTGGRGYHLWLFFEHEQNGLDVVNFLNEVKVGCELPALEIFPPSSSFGKSGYSKSLMRLPFGLHKKYNNARSALLKVENFEIIRSDQYAIFLDEVEFLSPDVLSVAKQRYEVLLSSKLVSYKSDQTSFKLPNVISDGNNASYIGSVGEMSHLCPAINSLISKAEREKNLTHNERFALAAIFKNYRDGEETLHRILSNCNNYDPEKSAYQLKTIQGVALSCKTLQSLKFGICPGWCNVQFSIDNANGKIPSPIWLSQLDINKENVEIDNAPSQLEQIASIQNLHHAYKQAVQQSKERDIFEDRLAFELFENDLWNNLEMLHLQLMSNSWKHNNFLLVETPKNIEENTFRPFCSISPREAIVELAILNIIGPPIDSMFNRNSLGNRLALSPKVDNQIFQDWRKQNRFREFKKKSFSNLNDSFHYVITDLKKFYEFIRHDKLISILKSHIDSQYILDLVQQYIEAPWERSKHEYGGIKRTIGIPQGPAISAFLANLYLITIDEWLD